MRGGWKHRAKIVSDSPRPGAEDRADQSLSRPVHHTLANHWARIIELVYAAERMAELAGDPEITDPRVRTLPTAAPREGVGVVEAPRGDPVPPLPDR